MLLSMCSFCCILLYLFCNVGLPAQISQQRRPRLAGCFHQQLHRSGHTSFLPQFRPNLLRHLPELRFGQDPLQRCGHRGAVARHGRQLLAVRRHRAGDLQPDAGGLSSHGVGDLICKARTDHHRSPSHQGLHETVLSAMSQEEVHLCLQDLNLRQVGIAPGILGHLQIFQGILLGPDGHHQQRHLTARLTAGHVAPVAEGVEGGGPGGVAQLFARETSWHLRAVPGHAVPAHIFSVGGQNRAHAHQNHLPSSLMGFPDLSQHIGLAVRRAGLQQWPHGDKLRVLIPLG
mmetsp:Transcript_1510/g.2656  ORF Transcript_1510/g.2656 Transcript_1510/m.2656 type:complete len:288 (-) Transcript_1510:659-1522(-)